MTVVRYPRRDLMVLRVEGSSPESVLSFLRLNSPHKHYEIIAEPSSEHATLRVQNSLDRGTIIGLLPSTVIVRDLDKSDVEFVYSAERLLELGINSQILDELIEAQRKIEGRN